MAEERKFKYTEQELRDRKIGKGVEVRGYGWEEKAGVYRDEGVWKAFAAIRVSFRAAVTDDNGYVYHEYAHRIATIIIDTFLLRRAKGENVTLPQPWVPQNVLNIDEDSVIPMHDMADFGEMPEKLDIQKNLLWIYNNLAVKNVLPANAPSPGAYAQLKFIQLNEQNMMDFLTKVFPRLIPSKSQLDTPDKLNDDNRTNFELLERLQSEMSESPSEVPIL